MHYVTTNNDLGGVLNMTHCWSPNITLWSFK